MSPFCPFRGGGLPKGDNVTFFYRFSYNAASLTLPLGPKPMCRPACHCQAHIPSYCQSHAMGWVHPAWIMDGRERRPRPVSKALLWNLCSNTGFPSDAFPHNCKCCKFSSSKENIRETHSQFMPFLPARCKKTAKKGDNVTLRGGGVTPSTFVLDQIYQGLKSLGNELCTLKNWPQNVICVHTCMYCGLTCGIWDWQSTIVKDLNDS